MVYQKTASTLRQQGLAPSKKMGQNFLVNAHTARRIAEVASVDPDEIVIEVGVGLGAGVRDAATADMLQSRLPQEHTTIRHNDAQIARCCDAHPNGRILRTC